MSDDRERELLYEVRKAMGDLYHEDDVMNVFHLVEKKCTAAAAEAREQDAALLCAKAARHWKAAEEHEEFGDDDDALVQESVALALEDAARTIRALRGGGR